MDHWADGANVYEGEADRSEVVEGEVVPGGEEPSSGQVAITSAGEIAAGLFGVMAARPHLTAVGAGLVAYSVSPRDYRWTAGMAAMIGAYVVARFVAPLAVR